jgi:hypothetical protein
LPDSASSFTAWKDRSRPHIHVEHGDKVAKFWLEPVSLAESHGFRTHELRRVRALVIERRSSFLEAWNAHFSR